MTLSSGTRLGQFEIADLLGIGGMGEVYRATDSTLGREVAIKVLPSDRIERGPILVHEALTGVRSPVASSENLSERPGWKTPFQVLEWPC